MLIYHGHTNNLICFIKRHSLKSCQCNLFTWLVINVQFKKFNSTTMVIFFSLAPMTRPFACTTLIFWREWVYSKSTTLANALMLLKTPNIYLPLPQQSVLRFLTVRMETNWLKFMFQVLSPPRSSSLIVTNILLLSFKTHRESLQWEFIL